MTVFFWILFSTFLVSLISFIGILTLVLKERFLNRFILIFVAFSAGALIGGSFLDLIPEAVSRIGISEISLLKIFLFLIFGFCLFFILENFLSWHHHHGQDHREVKPFSYLILISDALHNFLDGLIIASAFAIDVPLGLFTTLIIIFHEIPQELSDFAVLVYGGFGKMKALFLNFLSGALAVLGGIFGFFLSGRIGESIIFLLPFAAGGFIYIASSDLIPEIKSQGGLKRSFGYFFIFLTGIGVMMLLKLLD